MESHIRQMTIAISLRRLNFMIYLIWQILHILQGHCICEIELLQNELHLLSLITEIFWI